MVLNVSIFDVSLHGKKMKEFTNNRVIMKCNLRTSFSLRYLEFPELMFASDSKNRYYFDATLYIEQKGDVSKHSPSDFARTHALWINAICKYYDDDESSIIVSDEKTEHILIDESLALLFVAYIDPAFAVHILERMSEMLLNGFVLSDSCISQMAGDRLILVT